MRRVGQAPEEPGPADPASRVRQGSLAWEAQARIRRGLKTGCAVVIVAWLVGHSPPRTKPSGAGQVRAAAAGPPAWEDRRAELHAAHRARRAGDVIRAIGLYVALSRRGDARLADRETARYWQARLRIEEGECSALHDLESLVNETWDPARLALIALFMRRAMHELDALDGGCEVHHMQRILRVARSSLHAIARVDGMEADRARRWLARVDVTTR